MKKVLLKDYMSRIISFLRDRGRHATAHVYQSTMDSYLNYVGKKSLLMDMTSGRLKSYERHLLGRGLSWNTVSTYMRMLRAVYNRGVKDCIVPYIPYLFSDVHTGIVPSRGHRSLNCSETSKLLSIPEQILSPTLRTARDYFKLLLMLRGMPFIDFAHLRTCDLRGNTLSYYRHKTSQPLLIYLEPEAMRLVQQYRNKEKDSFYLFPILSDKEQDADTYKSYQKALRTYNYQLSQLALNLPGNIKLSSYTARHTWATTAYHCKMPIGIISSGLGHSSTKVTESYLKPFGNAELRRANKVILLHIMKGI